MVARDLGERRAVGAPPQLGLGADDEEDVLLGAGDRAGVDLGGGPDDLPEAVVVQADLRARGGEVVELLGVDLGHEVGVPAVDEVARRRGGGVAGVVPALEGGDDDGLLQRGTGRPADVVHRSTVPSGTSAPLATTTPACSAASVPAHRPRPWPRWSPWRRPAWPTWRWSRWRPSPGRPRPSLLRGLRGGRHHGPGGAAPGRGVGRGGARQGGLDVHGGRGRRAPCRGPAGFGRCRRDVRRRGRAPDDDRARCCSPPSSRPPTARSRGSARRRPRRRTANPAPRLTLVADPDATTTTAATTTTTSVRPPPPTSCPARRSRRRSATTAHAAAPWLIGAAIAAVLAIVIGGTLLKRRADRPRRAPRRDGVRTRAGGVRRRRWRGRRRRRRGRSLPVLVEAPGEALDEPVLARLGVEHGPCVGEGTVVAQRSHERGERVHGADCRAAV